MEVPLQRVSGSCEVRSVVRFLAAEGASVSDIHTRLRNVYGEDVMSERNVRGLVKQFREERRTNVHDEVRSGRPVEATNEETVRAVLAIVESDGRRTLNEIREQLMDEHCIRVSNMSVSRVLADAGLTKVCARWVPKLLTLENREARCAAARAFLDAYAKDPEMITRIVTGDESWVLYITPERKEATKVWHKKGDPPPKKCRLDRSTKKILCTPFWDGKGVLSVHFLDSSDGRMNSEVYCGVLDDLRKKIKRKRPGLLSAKVTLLHDNASCHRSKVTLAKLASFKWELFPHPANSPDLAPSDYHLFPKLKEFLGGKRFTDIDELKKEVLKWFREVGTQFYADGINKLLSRYEKCLAVNGDYVEK